LVARQARCKTKLHVGEAGDRFLPHIQIKFEWEDLMSRNRWPETVSAFVIGIGVGAALGVLFAPQSGEDTRDYLIGTAKDGIDQAVGTARDGMDQVTATGRKWARRAQQTVEDARSQVQDAAEQGEKAYRTAKNA
jgi:gas vesicle protein